MIISFPETKVGQAVISAIAIASFKKQPGETRITNIGTPVYKPEFNSWLDIGDRQYTDANIIFNSLPSNLFGAEWMQFSKKQSLNSFSFNVPGGTDVFIGLNKDVLQ
jgi:beta-galactosidase